MLTATTIFYIAMGVQIVRFGFALWGQGDVHVHHSSFVQPAIVIFVKLVLHNHEFSFAFSPKLAVILNKSLSVDIP